MRAISTFFLLVVGILLVSSIIDAVPVASTFRRNKNSNAVNGIKIPHRGIRVKDLPDKLRQGAGAPGLVYELQRAFNTQNITLLSSLFAPNASIFISSWGPARVDKATFVTGINGYFQSTAVVREDLFLRTVSSDFALGLRFGADIQSNYNQFTNTSGNMWWDLFAGFFRVTACNQGTQISTLDTYSMLTQQGNTTMTTQIIQQVFESFQAMDTGKVLSYFAKDGVFNLHPGGSPQSPCTGSCIEQMLQSYFSAVSNGRLKVTIENIAVNYNYVFVKRTDAMVEAGSPPGASILFEMDIVELDASYKIKSWDWYFAEPDSDSHFPVPKTLPPAVQALYNFVDAQKNLDYAALGNLFAPNARIFNWRAGFAPITKAEALTMWLVQMEQANQLVYYPLISLVNEDNVVCGRMYGYSISNINMNELNWYYYWNDGFCMYVDSVTGQIVEYGAFASPGFPYPQSNATQMMQTANNIYSSLQALNLDQMLTYFADDFVFRQVPNPNKLPDPCDKQCFSNLMKKVFSVMYKGLIKPYPLYYSASYDHLIALRKNFFVFTQASNSTPAALIANSADIFKMDGNFKIKFWENIEGLDF